MKVGKRKKRQDEEKVWELKKSLEEDEEENDEDVHKFMCFFIFLK